MKRTPVPLPEIHPAKHHIVELPPVLIREGGDMGKGERAALLAWLKQRAALYQPARTTSHLVASAIYEGLATRVTSGQFREKER